MIDEFRLAIRKVVLQIARGLNHLTKGRLTPNTITMIGLAGHIVIAWLIALRHPLWAGLLLIFFGLFDTLDGELARLQKRTSPMGMLLDASTDRFKEVLLYTGCAYFFVADGRPYAAVWAVAALGASLCVSYVKAKGETAIADQLPADKVNQLFKDGLARFEIRMVILIIGLLLGQLTGAVILVALLSSYTAVYRLIVISRALNRRYES